MSAVIRQRQHLQTAYYSATTTKKINFVGRESFCICIPIIGMMW
jgi:hypothetical protein